MSERAFANDDPILDNSIIKISMLRGIDMINSAAQDGDSSAGEACGMRLAINASGES
ncbi:MAG: hypothetical protein Hens2KO_12450 [Henriciella sp.]